MQEEPSEFTEFLRQVAAEERSEFLSDAADRLTARRQVAGELESLASQHVHVLEEMSAAVTPGAIPSRLVFDFTAVSRDVEVGVVLVPQREGERVLARALLESCREACSGVPALAAVVFVWMAEGLPATGMSAEQLQESLQATTGQTIPVPETKLNPVREVVAGVLDDQIRELPVPLGAKEEGQARASEGDALSVFREAVRRELEGIAKKRYHLEERKEAASAISEEQIEGLGELFEALMSAEEAGEEQLREQVQELAGRGVSADEEDGG